MSVLLLAWLAATAPASDQRIVSMGGGLTETLYALGLGDAVVGTDTSSLYPPEADALPDVGYFRTFSAEGVLSLQPTRIVITEGAGPPAALAQLEAAGLPIHVFPEARSVEASIQRIRAVGEAFGRKERAKALVEAIETKMATVKAMLAKREARPRVVFIYARGGGTMNVSGVRTAADAMITLAGGVNAVDAYEGFRPMSPEAVLAARPDVILMTDRGLEAVGGADKLLADPGLSMTPAGRARRVVSMPDLLLLGFTPRCAEAAYELAKALHDPA